MYRYKKKKGKKKERSTKTSLNSLARNARTFRKLSLSVRRISPTVIFHFKLFCAEHILAYSAKKARKIIG